MKVNHIGIIVDNIEKSVSLYSKLNYKLSSDITIDRIQNNKIVFMVDSFKLHMLEFIEPLGKESSIYNFPKGYHHICYETEKDEDVNYIKNLNIGKIIGIPIVAPALNNRKVIFVCLKDLTFAEFIIE